MLRRAEGNGGTPTQQGLHRGRFWTSIRDQEVPKAIPPSSLVLNRTTHTHKRTEKGSRWVRPGAQAAVRQQRAW